LSFVVVGGADAAILTFMALNYSQPMLFMV